MMLCVPFGQLVTKCICLCACVESRVRLATLELSCLLLKQSVLSGNHCIIKDVHLACLEVQHTHTPGHEPNLATYNLVSLTDMDVEMVVNFNLTGFSY